MSLMPNMLTISSKTAAEPVAATARVASTHADYFFPNCAALAEHAEAMRAAAEH